MLHELQEMLKQTYTVERELGGGGMSRVFVAHDLRLRRRVVVKLLSHEQTATLSIERFRREIQIAAKLRHPHIVPLLESGEVNGTLYYTMPFIEGESIRHRLRRDQTIPLREAIRLCAEVADALEYSHRQGIVHRDIKPENILLDSGHAVVTDFGIARAIAEANDRPLTTAGLRIGTLGYMSPEQASGDADVDGRSDVYSLACVLYEMVTGERPTSAAQSIRDATTRAKQFGRLLPTMSKALAVNRDLRFETASRFRDALKREAPSPSRRVTALGGLTVAVAGGLAALWMFLQNSKTSATSTTTWTRRQLSAAGRARFAAMSPNGQSVAYVSAGGLYVTDVITGESRQVAIGDGLRGIAWTSNGDEVSFQSRDTVYAVPRSGGASRIVLCPVNGAYAMAPDGKRIAWTTTTNGHSIFAIRSLVSNANSSASDSAGVVFRSDRSPFSMRWSPDGKWLAMTSVKGVSVLTSDASRETVIASGGGKIGERLIRILREWMAWSSRSDTLYLGDWTAEDGSGAAVTASVRQGTDEWALPIAVDTPANYRGSELSADNRRFAYVFGKPHYRLVRYALDGGRATGGLPVAPGDASDRHHVFAPDGKRAAFVRELPSGADLYVAPVEGGVPRRITHVNARSLSGVQWSPDGRSIAFVVHSDTASGIGVANPSTGDVRLIRTPLALVLSLPGRKASLAWAWDGSRVFFAAVHPLRDGSRALGGIGSIDLRSGVDTLLESSLVLAPIGSQSSAEIAFEGEMLASLVRMNWRTGHRDTIPMPRGGTPIRWDRDGSFLIMRPDSGSTEVVRLSPSSAHETQVALVPSRCLDVSLSPDGRELVCEEVEMQSEVWVATREEPRHRMPPRREP